MRKKALEQKRPVCFKDIICTENTCQAQTPKEKKTPTTLTGIYFTYLFDLNQNISGIVIQFRIVQLPTVSTDYKLQMSCRALGFFQISYCESLIAFSNQRILKATL